MSISPSLQPIFIPLSNDARAPAPDHSSARGQGTYHFVSTPESDQKRQPESDNRAATAKADGDLAVEVYNALRDPHNDKPLHIAPHSTLGMWFEQFKRAVHSPAFKAWRESQRFDGGEVDFHTANSSITWRPLDPAKQTRHKVSDKRPEPFEHQTIRSSSGGVGIEFEWPSSIKPADNEQKSPLLDLFKSFVKLIDSTNANQNKEIKLTGSEDQPAILGLAMAAATVIDSSVNRGLSAADADKTTLPLSTVLAFYDVDRNDPDVIAALGRDKAFAPITSPRAAQSDIHSLLAKLDNALAKGGKVVFVAGVDTPSNFGMGRVLGQEHNGKQPFLEILKKPGVNVFMANSSGVDILPDGTVTLVSGIGRGVLDQAATKEVLAAATD